MNVAQPLVQASLLGEAIDRGPVAVLVADEEMRYVAVNEFACEMLGYERSELLALKVSDIARYAEAASEYTEIMANRAGLGTSQLTRKDGSVFNFRYRASETKAAGMQLYVSVGCPESTSEPSPRRRRLAHGTA